MYRYIIQLVKRIIEKEYKLILFFILKMKFLHVIEIKFHDENYYNYINITFICLLQSYIPSINEALHYSITERNMTVHPH